MSQKIIKFPLLKKKNPEGAENTQRFDGEFKATSKFQTDVYTVIQNGKQGWTLPQEMKYNIQRAIYPVLSVDDKVKARLAFGSLSLLILSKA